MREGHPTGYTRDYPFEVRIAGRKTVGAVLADRVGSFDWRARRASRIEQAPAGVFDETVAKLLPLIE